MATSLKMVSFKRTNETAELSPRIDYWLRFIRGWCADFGELICAPDTIPHPDLVALRCAGLIDVVLQGERLHVWPVGGAK